MIWSTFVIFLGLTSLENTASIDVIIVPPDVSVSGIDVEIIQPDESGINPEALDKLRAAGEHEKLAEILGVDVEFIRPVEGEQTKGSRYIHVSFLGDIMMKKDAKAWSPGDFEQNPTMKWPNNQMPFVIGSDFRRKEKRKILNGIQIFNERSEHLKMVKYNGEKDYLYIISGTGCWSYVGRITGHQTLSLQRNGCLNTGNILHEFLHAAGFTHEHNRHDRDKYLTVLWDNIPSEWQSQYEKVNGNDLTELLGYDYYSLMHYPLEAPGTEKAAFALPPGVNRSRLGQDDGLSITDAKKLSLVYRK